MRLLLLKVMLERLIRSPVDSSPRQGRSPRSSRLPVACHRENLRLRVDDRRFERTTRLSVRGNHDSRPRSVCYFIGNLKINLFLPVHRSDRKDGGANSIKRYRCPGQICREGESQSLYDAGKSCKTRTDTVAIDPADTAFTLAVGGPAVIL